MRLACPTLTFAASGAPASARRTLPRGLSLRAR